MAYGALFFSAGILLFDVPVGAIIKLLLSPTLYFAFGGMIFTGLALWEGKRFGLYLGIPAHLLLLYFHAVIAIEYSASHYKGIAFLVAVLFQVASYFKVYRELRVPYFSPRIRWWESNPRYKLNVPVKGTQSNGGVPFTGDILDISMGGCFIKLRGELALDEQIGLAFAVFGHQLQCEGVVVWKTQSTVTHPRGVGVKFLPLSRAQKRDLKQTMKRLKKIATFYTRNRYLMSQEEFLKKFEELEATPRPTIEDSERKAS